MADFSVVSGFTICRVLVYDSGVGIGFRYLHSVDCQRSSERDDRFVGQGYLQGKRRSLKNGE